MNILEMINSFSENNGGAAHDVNRPHVTDVHQLQVLHLQATWMHQVGLNKVG